MKELLAQRKETSKTFDLGNGKRRFEGRIGAIHYKDNYSDEFEEWKDIDLTWKDNYISTAPYELTRKGNKITFKDKKTGEVSTLELLNVKPSHLKFDIVPFNRGVHFRHTIPVNELPFEARFKVTGKIPRCNAADNEGGVKLETTFKNGILVERISEVKDLDSGKLRKARGDIRVDPTETVQPPAKDVYLNEAQPTTNKDGQDFIRIRDLTSYFAHPMEEFDISGVPGGASISAATLSLYYYTHGDNDPNGKTVWTYKLTRNDWVENQATWNIYKTGSNWTAAGGDYATSNPSGGSTTFPASYGWMAFDVKAIVEDAIDNESWSVAEFLQRFGTEPNATDSNAYWYSNDYAGDSTKHPKLAIDYTTSIPRHGFVLFQDPGIV